MMNYRHVFSYPASSIPVEFLPGVVWEVLSTTLTYDDLTDTLTFHHEILDVK